MGVLAKHHELQCVSLYFEPDKNTCFFRMRDRQYDPTVAQLADDLDDCSFAAAVSANDQHVLHYYFT